jgi:two-component system chemotaxis sensor kinase CheA
VNLDRVDRLINLIGELVIMEAMLSQAVESAGPRLRQRCLERSGWDQAAGLGHPGKRHGDPRPTAEAGLPEDAQDYPRGGGCHRETGSAGHVGEATEVDKTVIERLVDPLTHMIRNSVDHGLEDTSARAATGKPETGTITLSAAHRSGRVIIEVSDDGAGINREKVRQIAEEKGLVAPGASLSPSEIDNLLFTPGLLVKGRSISPFRAWRRARRRAPRDPGARRARHDPVHRG